MSRFLELLAADAPMSAALAIAIKATLLLVAAFIVAALLRRRSAAIRHLVWTLSLGGIVALALPWPDAPVPVTVPAVEGMREIPASLPNEQISSWTPSPVEATSSLAAAPVADFARFSARQALLLFWLLGVAAVFIWALLGRVGLSRLTRRAESVDSEEWNALLRGAAAELGVPRLPRLRRSRSVTTPLVWGALKPVILLPSDSESWPLDRKRVVLLHEMAHIARHDAFTQLLSVLACALYWPHPLAWLAARRQRLERERACDDTVLALGTPGHVYAAELLELARGAAVPRFAGMFAAGMARPTELEGRLVAALETRARRSRVSIRLATASAIVTLLVALPLAIVRPELRAAMPDTGENVAPTSDQHEVARPASDSAPVRAETGPLPRLTSAEVDTAQQLAAPSAAVETAVAQPDESDPDSVVEYSVQAKAGERLTIDLETGGTVFVRPGDDSRVSVRAELAGRNWAETRVAVERVTDGVRLRSTFVEAIRNTSTSHRFVVRVPKRFDIRLRSSGGGLDVAGIEGTIRGHTGGGNLRFQKMKGELAITTGGGEVRVLDSELDGHVSTGGGLVIVSRVNGDLNAESGSGPVIRGDVNDASDTSDVGRSTTSTSSTTTFTDDFLGDSFGSSKRVRPDEEMERAAASGAVRIQKAGGGIRLPSAPHGATVSTGGGDISIGRVNGDIEAKTGGGDIELGPVSGSAYASTGAGKVDISLEGAGSDRDVRVFTGYGRVTIELPSSFGAALDLETAFTRADKPTRIVSDWNLPAASISDWDESEGTARRYVRIRTTIGGGGNDIRVKAVNGDIVLKRR